MSKKTYRIIFSAIGITLFTGFIPRSFMIGASGYGWPFPWLNRLVLAPEYFPWRIDWMNLVLDIFLWSLLFYIIHIKKRKQ